MGTPVEGMPEWQECISDDGYKYYWNVETGDTTWELPKPKAVKPPPPPVSKPMAVPRSNISNTTTSPNSYGSPNNFPSSPIASSSAPSYSSPPNTNSTPPEKEKSGGLSKLLRKATNLNVLASQPPTIRTITYEGPIMKKGFLAKLSGMGTWKNLFCVLTDKTLRYYFEQSETTLKGELYLSGVFIEEDKVVKRPNVIHMVTLKKKHICWSADSKQSMDDWIHALRSVAKGNAHEISSSSSTPNVSSSPPASSKPVSSSSSLAVDNSRMRRRSASMKNFSSVKKADTAPPASQRNLLSNSNPIPVPTNNTSNGNVRSPVKPLPAVVAPPQARAVQAAKPLPNAPMLPPRTNETPVKPITSPPSALPNKPTPASIPPRIPLNNNNNISTPKPMNTTTVNHNNNSVSRGGRADTANSSFKPNFALKTMGAHTSISLPTSVVHTAKFDADSFTWALQNGLQMMGHIERQVGNSWQPVFCIIDSGFLKMYYADSDIDPYEWCDLKDSVVDPYLGSNKSHSFQVTTANNTNCIFSCATKDEFSQWMCAVKINGAADGEFSKKDKEMREKQIAEQRKMASKLAIQQEEEYIKSKRDLLDARQANLEKVAGVDVVTCYAACEIVHMREYENDIQFKIHVVFDIQEYFIHRTEKEMSTMYNQLGGGAFAVITINSLRGSFPKKPKENVLSCQPYYQEFLNRVLAERAVICNNMNANKTFVRFFAPVKYGDEKPPGFAMPFRIDV